MIGIKQLASLYEETDGIGYQTYNAWLVNNTLPEDRARCVDVSCQLPSCAMLSVHVDRSVAEREIAWSWL